MESRSSVSLSVRHAPFAEPVARDPARPNPQSAGYPGAEDAYPLIDQFLDELPSIVDYLEDAPILADAAQVPLRAPAEIDSEGWAIAGWQSYAWESLASLGRSKGERKTPEQAWPPEPWAVPLEADPGPSPDEVAAALDDIAQRIRSGELPIDQFQSTSPQAAMAAVIAAMLRLQG